MCLNSHCVAEQFAAIIWLSLSLSLSVCVCVCGVCVCVCVCVKASYRPTDFSFQNVPFSVSCFMKLCDHFQEKQAVSKKINYRVVVEIVVRE